HLAVPVVVVTEGDRLGRARLLAGGRDPAVLHAPVGRGAVGVLFRLPARLVDALHAPGALLHHTAAADRDVRVQLHLVRLRERLRVVEEVEATDFVRTVVGAVARSDAAVVRHVVEAFRRVRGGADRADALAGRVLALLAEHRHGDGASLF